MTVYVDAIMNHGWVLRGRVTPSCHMFADTDEQLHEMASRIGMRESWYQAPKTPMHIGHYDLTEKRRKHAVELGAKEVTREGLVAFMRRHRAAQNKTVLDLTKKYGLICEGVS